jgi:hypothetical protein
MVSKDRKEEIEDYAYSREDFCLEGHEEIAVFQAEVRRQNIRKSREIKAFLDRLAKGK